MRFSVLSVALLSAAGGVFADETLDKIVEKMPGCAVSCYADACNKSGCSPEDFKCVCNSLVRLPSRMGNCLGKNSCTNYDAQDSLQNVCSRMDKNPSATEVSAASSVVAHAIATATPTKANAGARDMAAVAVAAVI